MMTKKMIDTGEREIQVLVDNKVAVSNVTRMFEKMGYSVAQGGEGTDLTVTGTGGDSAAQPAAKDSDEGSLEDVAILVSGKELGKEDRELGEVLIKGFLGALAERDRPPRVVALMNEGVFLALDDHTALESLRQLEAKGTELLVCGTCTTHFGVTDRVGAGVVSNMFDISEALLGVARTVCLG